MAGHNLETIRQVYERVLARGRMEDPATSQILPELFDPEIRVRQMSSLMGTAGDFHGYGGLAESGRETVPPFAELEFVPQEIEAVGEHVATVAVVRGVGRLSGAPLEARVGHLFTLRDGRVLRFELFDNPSDAFRAAGLMPAPAPPTRRGDPAAARDHAARALELSREHGYGAFEPRAAALLETESAAGT